MTDRTGLIQHAVYCLPRRDSGYCIDDNARALRLCARLWQTQPSPDMLERVACYLGFVESAQRADGLFHNFLSYNRVWLDDHGCDDCQGQAALALSEVIASELPEGFRRLAADLMHEAEPAFGRLKSLRAQAYLVTASAHLWRGDVDGYDALHKLAKAAADRLLQHYADTRTADWPWFEDRLTYANAVLPHALFDAAACWGAEAMASAATATFAFLDRVTTPKNVFCPIGNDGWFPRDGRPAPYDQQPVEASTMADASLAAFRTHGNEAYLHCFWRARLWFRGQNAAKRPLADAANGACFDALIAEGVNLNQGAESTLAYLWTEQLAPVVWQITPDDARPSLDECLDLHLTRNIPHQNSTV